VLCNTPTRIPEQIKRTYALDRATASDAMRAYGVGEWCRRTLGYRLDMEHACKELCDWVVREMDRTPPEVAAAMHDCFEGQPSLSNGPPASRGSPTRRAPPRRRSTAAIKRTIMPNKTRIPGKHANR
jgi:hypothetical protein